MLGWRDVPINSKVVGEIASKSQPTIKQVFISKNEELSEKEFNIKLYIARKISENNIYESELSQKIISTFQAFTTEH